MSDISALKNGKLFCRFIFKLTGREPKLSPGSDSSNLSYLSAAFSVLEDYGLPLAAITCTYEEVDEGDEATLLSLVWELADFFFIAKQFPECANGLWKSKFLAWCQDCCRQSCGPRGISVTDFHKSFQNGLALCAIVDSAIKNPNLIAMSTLRADRAEANVTLALSVAKKVFGVPPLLNAWEFSAALPDERSTILYLSVLRRSILNGPTDLNTSRFEDQSSSDACLLDNGPITSHAQATISEPMPGEDHCQHLGCRPAECPAYTHGEFRFI